MVLRFGFRFRKEPFHCFAHLPSPYHNAIMPLLNAHGIHRKSFLFASLGIKFRPILPGLQEAF